MEIEKNQPQGNIIVLKVRGNIDMSTCMSLRDSLMDCTKKKIPAIVLDFSSVEYMDSAGLATLVEAFQSLIQYGGALKLANLRPAVKDLIHLAKMDRLFKVFATLDEALK